jgi:hypothetical protein
VLEITEISWANFDESERRDMIGPYDDIALEANYGLLRKASNVCWS